MILNENPTLTPTNIQAISDTRRGFAAPEAAVEQAREASQRLEASFLSEMLKSAGFGMQTNSFSGSAGEDQFASFQRDALAQHMVQAGGIGLAEHFFNAMMEAQRDAE
ncbi:MAG: rod-binding protein [Pseudomonadota bacterium]